MISPWLTAFFVRLFSRRILVLSVAAALAGLSFLISTRLILEENIAVMLPKDDPMAENLLDAMARFRNANRLQVDVSSDTASRNELFAAADQCHDLLMELPGIAAVDYRHDAESMMPLLNVFIEYVPLLIRPDELPRLAEQLTPDRLEQRLAWFKTRMGTPQGMALKDVPLQDPIGARDLILQRLRPLLTGFGLSPTDGRIMSADARHVLIMLESDFPSSDSRASAPFVQNILEVARRIETNNQAANVRVQVAGAHRAAVDNAAMIRADAQRTIMIGLLAMLVVCLLAYRRPWFALLTFIPTSFGVLVAGAVLAVANPHLSAIAVGCASMLAGIGVDYAVHVLYHFDDQAGLPRQERARILARLTFPISIGLLTTMAAFLVMIASSVPGHKQMGWFGCLTMAASAACALLVLPLLVPVASDAKIKKHDAAARGFLALRLTGSMALFFQWRAKHAHKLLAVFAVLALLAVCGWPRLVFDGSFFNLNGIFPETRKAEQELQRVWGDFTRLTLVTVKGNNLEQAWQKTEHLLAALRGPSTQGRPEAILSPTDLCPSIAEQRKNIEAWQNFWTQTRRAQLTNNLAVAAAKLGYRTEPLLARAAGLGLEPVAPGALTPHHPALQKWIKGRVSCQTNDAQLVLAARVPQGKDLPEFQRRVLEAVPDAAVLDNRIFAEHLVDLTRNGLKLFAIASTAAVAGVLFLFFGSAVLVLAALIPLGAGIGLAFGCLGWMGVPLNLANIVFVIFLVGVGIDYSVFLVTSRLALHRGAGNVVAAAGGSVLVCMLTTMAGFGALAFARHPALWSIGWTALPGIVCVLMSNYLLTPWIMDQLLKPAPKPMLPITNIAAKQKAIQKLYSYQGRFVEQFIFWKIRMDPMFQELDALVPEQALVLDLGCGYGIQANWLALGSEKRRILGVDLDENKLAVARRACIDPHRIHFETGNINTWPGQIGNVVLMLDVMHYWQPEQQQQLLLRARALLQPGGLLLIREGIAGETGKHDRQVRFWERFAVAIGHNKKGNAWHYPSLPELDSQLKLAGFSAPRVCNKGQRGANRLILADAL